MHNFNIDIRILCMIDRIEIAVVCCVIIKYYSCINYCRLYVVCRHYQTLYIQLLVFCSSRAGNA